MTAVTCETYDLTFNSKDIKSVIESGANVGDSVMFIPKGGSNSMVMVVYR